MLKSAAALLVFLGGFAVMVLEIIGARFLAKDFGGSFYVWISQIGVILVALALGYALGHPLDREIPELWRKLDPVLGSTLVFFLPCFSLAILPPYMIRLMARRLERVGTVSGLIYAASTVGSIAGVFVSGYVLIDYLAVPDIFRTTGILTLSLAGASLVMDRWFMAK